MLLKPVEELGFCFSMFCIALVVLGLTVTLTLFAPFWPIKALGACLSIPVVILIAFFGRDLRAAWHAWRTSRLRNVR